MIERPPTGPKEVSKSQRKREALALQQLGHTLVALNPSTLERIPLSDEVREAIDSARQIKTHGARKRQLHYIGKLLRHADAAAIASALAAVRDRALLQTARLKQIERWRDHLIEQGDAALNRLLRQYPNADRQHFRQLIRGARREAEQAHPPTAARAIFRSLRELIGS